MLIITQQVILNKVVTLISRPHTARGGKAAACQGLQ